MDNGFNKFRKLFSPKDKLRFAVITLLMALSGIVESLGIGVLLAAVTVFLKPGTGDAAQLGPHVKALHEQIGCSLVGVHNGVGIPEGIAVGNSVKGQQIAVQQGLSIPLPVCDGINFLSGC